MFVCCEYCVSGRGLCDELITRPEESYQLLWVVVCQVEVSATNWSLVHRSPTDCGESLCVIKEPQEGGCHGPLWAVAQQKKRKLFFYIVATNFQALVTACDEFLYAFVIDLRRHSSLLHCFEASATKKFFQCWRQVKIAWSQLWCVWWMTYASAMSKRPLLYLDEIRFWNRSYKQEECLHLEYDAVYSGRSCRISEGTRSSEKSARLQQITLHHIPEVHIVRSLHPENRKYRDF